MESANDSEYYLSDCFIMYYKFNACNRIIIDKVYHHLRDLFQKLNIVYKETYTRDTKKNRELIILFQLNAPTTINKGFFDLNGVDINYIPFTYINLETVETILFLLDFYK